MDRPKRTVATDISYVDEIESDSAEDDYDDDEVMAKEAPRSPSLHSDTLLAVPRVDDDNDSSDSDWEATRKRKDKKKPKKGKSKQQSKQQKKERFASPLEMIKSLPIEVLLLPIEVLLQNFRYMKPLDLVHISSVSKMYHHLMLDRKSKSTWAQARANVKMPKLTAKRDFSEYALAMLVFGVHCVDCGKKTKSVDYGLRRRLCPNCRQKHYIQAKRAASSYDLHASTLFCALSTKITAAGNCTVWDSHILSDLIEISNTLTRLEHGDQAKGITQLIVDARFPSLRRKDPEADGSSSGEESEEHEEVLVERNVPAHFSRYVAMRKKIVAAAKADAAALTNYRYSPFRFVVTEPPEESDPDFSSVSTDVEDQRLEAIGYRIRALGYDRYDFPEDHWLAARPMPLTDHEWDEIRDEVILAVQTEVARADERVQHHWRRQEVKRRYSSFITKHCNGKKAALVPPPTTFVWLPSIMALWSPVDSIVNDVTWRAAKSTVLRVIKEHHQQRRNQYFLAMADALQPGGADFDPGLVARVRRATAGSKPNPAVHDVTDKQTVKKLLSDPVHIFVCCSQVHDWPALLSHMTSGREHQHDDARTTRPPKIIVSLEMYITTRHLMRFLDRLDSNELQALGAVFECMDCPGYNGTFGRTLERWSGQDASDRNLTWAQAKKHAIVWHRKYYTRLTLRPLGEDVTKIRIMPGKRDEARQKARELRDATKQVDSDTLSDGNEKVCA